MSVYAEYTLCSKLRIVTAGNPFASPIFVDLTVSDDLTDLSGVEEMTLISLTEGISAQLRWNIYFASGFTRATELAGGPFQLSSAIAGNGSLRAPPYNTLTNMLPVSRFMVGFGNNTGVLQESALVSAMLLVKRIS